jgi:hypothetical protein
MDEWIFTFKNGFFRLRQLLLDDVDDGDPWPSFLAE